jgi:hypothetical protein
VRLEGIPFQLTDWAEVPAETHPGDAGVATWRVKRHGDIRVRMVEYSSGYVADHWCEKGHILLCVKGELHTRLKDGRIVVLTPGMSYEVADGAEAHRSEAPRGATLFIVD